MTSSPKSLSRRGFIFRLVTMALPVVAAAGGLHWLRHLLSPSRSQARQRAEALLRATMRSRGSVARVGRHYLRMTPEEHSIDTLVTLVLQQLPDPDHLMKDASVERIRTEVARGIREDFACGRTSRVQGWVLARTEARLAALAALL